MKKVYGISKWAFFNLKGKDWDNYMIKLHLREINAKLDRFNPPKHKH